MNGPIIQFAGVNKWFGKFHVLKDIGLEVGRGERIVVCGPSGSGKSTLIRCMNRLEEHQEGRIVVDGVELTENVKSVERVRREVGMVFQQFNLFPHMSVWENVALAPRVVRGAPGPEARRTALALLERVGLSDKALAHPSELSGGQQQRAAIARALAMEPAALLFDEPTSALDPELRGEVLEVMRSLAAEGRTMAVVTHEVAFAHAVAHEVIFMDEGRVVERGPPSQVIDSPRNERTRRFFAS